MTSGSEARSRGAKAVEGIVTLKSSRHAEVQTPEGSLRCALRGKFRLRSRAVPVAGDRVIVTPTGPGEGVLEEVLPRRTELERGTASGKPVLVAANVDQLLVVVAAAEPPPRWTLVDRMLVAAHRDDLEPVVCLNKWDQVDGDPEAARGLEETLSVYRSLGYATVVTSARDGFGLDALAERLRGKITALAGHSGVGKSSLLNRLNPDLRLEVRELNAVTGKGRHATSVVRLLPLPFGGYAVDTPGFREFQPVEVTRPELGRQYVEFRPLLGMCRYRDCLHVSEPHCAVREAVEAGKIHNLRYQNYLQILSTLGGGASP